MKKQYISRKGNFDSGHRVMNERMKCFNIHGHTYHASISVRGNPKENGSYIRRTFRKYIRYVL